ncbi:7d3b786c-e683-4a74-9c55-cad679dd41bb [Sclerotinia trifoliorum]|uniref:7d3b786c-e683-4a74-9c55-cad679dd41bb n=1 Tax=Sclerotinia trifoliorum TaxID=28548 RepID=A0A8H2VZ78_9HELO|nr:7d3b786c-e683-4a74-9c55-cad679dd41bb [Sclerotinia trifoliorum]
MMVNGARYQCSYSKLGQENAVTSLRNSAQALRLQQAMMHSCSLKVVCSIMLDFGTGSAHDSLMMCL